MRNPYFDAKEKSDAIQAIEFDGSDDDEARWNDQDRAWKSAARTSNPRLPLAAIRAADMYNRSYDEDAGKRTIDLDTAAATFVPDYFEAKLVALALDGWWNDVLGESFASLGLDIDGDWGDQIATYLEQNPHMDVRYDKDDADADSPNHFGTEALVGVFSAGLDDEDDSTSSSD